MNKFQSFFFRVCLACTLAFFSVCLTSCHKNYTPKPRSYFRIDFPEKKYVQYHSEGCPYSFEVPVYSKVVPFEGRMAEPCWINIEFPGYKGVLHITYKTLSNNLGSFVEDIHTLAYKHSIKADDIIEKPFYYPDRKVNGILYDIRGNTASSLSFFVTDSTRNFLSGALYFNVIPNKDSLAPVIQFFSADVQHLIETITWN
ncbi:MAG TPA: gliding motility lipoprotein GldD [Bacteroidales bacterium]|nr:gliding motility lipoprotein GldD [Bacteroidales bacterium]